MAASLSFLSLTPQTLSIHHPSSASSLFTPSFLKPLPKHVLSLKSIANYANPSSSFVRNVATSSGLDSEVDEDEGFDYSGQQIFPPELKLYVGNLPYDVDSSRLADLFQQAGDVAVAEVIYDRLSGRSKGFGFVTMSTIEEVEAAVQLFNGYDIQGRVLRVNSGPAPPKRENTPPSFRGGPRGGGSSSDSSNRVYVGNLAWGVDNLTLETMFAEHGNVKEATVIFDRESGRSKGFGFVTYCSSDEVNNAIESMDGMDVDGRCLRVSRAEARPPRREY
ncbi:29 kDa ribonucleoprotein a chloroplastic [Phtheirospermum japonicum]|uniref:29 kDa ribonucleoprotein a chloroplastic n=1 Tax=Phtheirospermum japonicum TaxID=374723 RepID=A0A830BVY9_9LAMI|nr:29 kDa ribonucleoprotein a chloroplastic [Phtheirospermum japonicum]